MLLYLFDCIVCGIDWCGRAMSPKGAILLQSPGRKPWVNHWNTFIEPLQGRHFQYVRQMPALLVSLLRSSICFYLCFPRVSYRALPSFHPGLCRSAALAGLFVGLAVCPQGSISGFALISPWAMQECRPCRAHCRIGCVPPEFHIGLRPHFTLGYAGVSPFQGSLSDWAFAVLCRGIVFVKCVLGG